MTTPDDRVHTGGQLVNNMAEEQKWRREAGWRRNKVSKCIKEK